jgi:hypothetical protein
MVVSDLLEVMIALDMVKYGYDCNDELDIAAYWETRLS